MTPNFFTQPRCYVVPHDRIGLRAVLIMHQAITRAFEIIRKEGFALGAALENEITAELENALENRVRNRGEVEGFDNLFFGKVTRGNEVKNFNATKISKKPDLMFYLRRENRHEWDQCQDALFTECKPVDRQHSLRGHYCAVDKDCTGIERFIIGDYAWAMEEAFMIGYVRDGIQIVPDLAKALREPSRRKKLGEPDELVPVESPHPPQSAHVLHRSRHQRLFTWQNGRPATPIDVFHSWHDCSY